MSSRNFSAVSKKKGVEYAGKGLGYGEMKSGRSRLYDDAFFSRHTDATVQSARIIVPHVLRKVRPRKVVDVGCALGAWLKVFAEHGAEVIQGLDGHYVDSSKLLIRKENFTPVDLVETIKSDINPVMEKADGRYDLAVCLEVAEHLPESSAPDLVRMLTTLAPIVLFSAAVPGQGGVGHINEQWPDYWKQRFEERGFERVDGIRRHIWNNQRVHWWYRQNIFLFATRAQIERSASLREEERLPRSKLLYIHCFNRYRRLRNGLAKIFRAFLNVTGTQTPRWSEPRRRAERFFMLVITKVSLATGVNIQFFDGYIL
jgi:SAM-dependent methyltransferase